VPAAIYGRWVIHWSGNPDKLDVWSVHPDGTGAALLQRVTPTWGPREYHTGPFGVSPDGPRLVPVPER
jgi:hypothetical protein